MHAFFEKNKITVLFNNLLLKKMLQEKIYPFVEILMKGVIFPMFEGINNPLNNLVFPLVMLFVITISLALITYIVFKSFLPHRVSETLAIVAALFGFGLWGYLTFYLGWFI